VYAKSDPHPTFTTPVLMLYPSLKYRWRRAGLYRAPRGTSDILPREQAYWRYVEQKVLDICQLYGYERIDVPAFEDTSLFSRSVGEGTDIVDKEMYTFEDRGGNSLTLRPEGTASICRAYIQHGMHNLTQPVKLYYVASIFRYDRPQAGRYRQHYQFGGEAFGDDDPALDAEVIDMAWQFFASLGLGKLSLQLNSIGCKECRPGYIAALKNYYSTYTTSGSRWQIPSARHPDSLCPDCKTRLKKNPLRLLDCKKPACRKIAASAPGSTDYLCPQCDEHFNLLKKYLGLLDIPFVVNHRLVRGLDYYTRTVFEIQPGVEGAQSALVGGGRYDNLIEELGGKPTPALGFATGIERIIINLKEQNVPIPPLPRPQVFIAQVGDEARDEAIKLAATLRRKGIGVIEATANKSLKAQLRQANGLGVRYTIIIGEEEVKANKVTLRDMTTARQETISPARLHQKISA
jgi:histidyl-tRNA synthetase